MERLDWNSDRGFDLLWEGKIFAQTEDLTYYGKVRFALRPRI